MEGGARSTFESLISKIDDKIEEMEFAKEISSNNRFCMQNITKQLRNEEKNMVEIIQLMDKLESYAKSCISSSTVSDQIICDFECAKKKYKELKDVHYDFTDLESFKRRLIEDSIDAMTALKVVYGINTQSTISLLEKRLIHFDIIQLIKKARIEAQNIFFTGEKVEAEDKDAVIQSYKRRLLIAEEEARLLKDQVKQYSKEISEEKEGAMKLRATLVDVELRLSKTERVLKAENDVLTAKVRELERLCSEAMRYKQGYISLQAEILSEKEKNFQLSAENEELKKYSAKLRKIIEEAQEYYSEYEEDTSV